MSWPICAVCNKPVDKVMSCDDFYTGGTRYAVECHGEREESLLTPEDLLTANRIEFGTAFRRNDIPKEISSTT